MPSSQNPFPLIQLIRIVFKPESIPLNQLIRIKSKPESIPPDSVNPN